MTLTDTVADPVKTHVNGFGAVELDRVVGYADGAGVVAEDDGGWLGVAEGDGDGTQPFADAGEHVQAGVFTFCNGSNDDVDDAAVYVDGSVDVGGLTGVAEVGDAAGNATRT